MITENSSSIHEKYGLETQAMIERLQASCSGNEYTQLERLLSFLEAEKLSDIVYYHAPANWISGAFICTATSPRHIDAVADKLRRFHFNEQKMIIDGEAKSQWVIASACGYIVHLFTQEMREYYMLDAFWHKKEGLR